MKTFLVDLIHIYRAMAGGLGTALPWLSPCSFQPTCSHYAEQALNQHPFGRAVWLSVKRILRCHPFHSGGWDPVPPSTTH